jgi:hypothetical protein
MGSICLVFYFIQAGIEKIRLHEKTVHENVNFLQNGGRIPF